MADRPPTRKQHFVPTFYLKQFANQNGFVEVFKPRANRILKPRPYASVCYDDFFYGIQTGQQDEISQAFELAFGAAETRFAARLPAILERLKFHNAQIQDFDDLAHFMSVQWQRTNSFRNEINRLQEDVIKKVMQFSALRPESIRDRMIQAGQPLTDEQLQDVCRLFQDREYSLKFNNAMHLRLISQESINGFRNLFFCKRWNIIKASGQYRFITTDNPVCDWSRKSGPYGVPFSHKTHYFALTPDVLVESVALDDSVEPLSQPVIDRVTYRDADADETLMFNMVVTNRCERFCYSAGRLEFQQLIAQLREPGRAMRQYVERFLAPTALG